MYHRQHINYPLLFLIIALLLLTWAVSYALITAPGVDWSGLFTTARETTVAPSPAMVQLAPGFYVPRDYYIQEKMYHAPAVQPVALAAANVEVAPGFYVPRGYYIQEKMYYEGQ